MRHARHCLAQHPGISSNINNATHFNTPPMPPTLAQHSPYPSWHTTHAIHTGTSPKQVIHVTHVSTQTTVASTQARNPGHPRQLEKHIICETLPVLIAGEKNFEMKILVNWIFISVYIMGPANCGVAGCYNSTINLNKRKEPNCENYDVQVSFICTI